MRTSIRTSIATFWICLFSELLALAALGADMPVWETDIDRALERSKKEKKDILLAFRGPSSNPNCKVVNEKVYGGIEFRTILGHQFVLFSVVDPKDKELDQAQKAAYKALLARFSVNIYPIILLADSEGRVYGQTTIQRLEAKFFVQAVGELGPRRVLMDKALKLAKDSESEGANLKKIAADLSAILDQLGSRFVIQHHLALLERVVALDKEDAQGLKSLWEKRTYDARSLRVFNQIWFSIARKMAEETTVAGRIALLEETIKKHSMEGELLQLMEMRKFLVWNAEKNYQKMLEVARKAYALAPDTSLGKRIPKFIEGVERLLAESKSEGQPAPQEAPKEGQNPAAGNPAEGKSEKAEQPQPQPPAVGE